MKSWKTTLIGIIAGIATATNSLVDANAQGSFETDNYLQLAIAVAFALMGAFSKDKNVTGGSVPQTPEAVGRATEKKI